MAERYYNPPRWQMPMGGYNPPRSRFWSPPPVSGQQVDPAQEAMWPDQLPPEIAQQRAQAAIAQMQAQAMRQPMPGDMPVGAPIPQQGFAPQTAGQGDPVSPTGGQRPMPPMGPMSPGGAMPSTTPDMIQTGMAPVGGTAGPTTEIYGESYPTSPVGAMSPTTPQVPSAARNVVEEMMSNRGGNAPWLALAAAGFGAGAGQSPHALTNINAGGLKGIEMYDRMSDRNARDRLAAATTMLGVENQDRQAGFRQQELGQGERRIDLGYDELRSKDADRKQAREDAAAKLRHEERKLDVEAPLRRAQAGYYDAQSEYTRGAKALAAEGAGDARKSKIITDIDQRARQYAKDMTPGDEMTKDPAMMQKLYKEHAAVLAQGAGIDPAVFGVYPPAPSDPRLMQPGRIYKTPKGPLRWNGSEFEFPVR